MTILLLHLLVRGVFSNSASVVSMSDVIKVNGDFYYVDTFGFVKVDSDSVPQT